MRARSRSPIHWLCLVVLTLLVVALPAFAADAPKKDAAAASADKAAKGQQDAMMAEMMKYANPGPMHALLDPLVGKWKTVNKSWMGPGEPIVSEGECERMWLLGGRFLQSKYTGTFQGMPFEGMELLGYDMKKKEYSSVWIDNMGTTLSLGTGGQTDPSGKLFTMTSSFDDPVTGKSVPYRMVTKVIDNNSHTFSMIGTNNGKDYTQMEISYTRVK
jgi:hypothetical protein